MDSCNTCSDGISCSTCTSSGGVTLYLNSTSNLCVSTCSAGFFEDASLANDHRCTGCETGCTLCYGSGLTKCTACDSSGSTKYYKVIGQDSCVTECGPGYYELATNSSCVTCDSNCA